jgi:cytochrome c oxidase cbb3-type subunit III
MKKVVFILPMMGLSFGSVAQATETASFWTDPFSSPMLPIYALITLISVVILLILLVAVYLIRVLNTLTDNVAKERAEKLGVVYKPSPTYWERFTTAANKAVPVEEERKIELDHNYDGIRELDNHLPPWWKYLFYVTIVWSVIYLVVYHVTDSLPLQEDEYREQVAKADDVKRKYLATQPKVEIDENSLSYFMDNEIITKGKSLYSSYCSSCHKADGGGSIGPNLTDEYWIHGGDIKNIFAVIKNGVPEKGMVSWASVLNPEQLRDVSFYVMSLQGSNPPGAKQPQGTVFKNDTPVQRDSTQVQASL